MAKRRIAKEQWTWDEAKERDLLDVYNEVRELNRTYKETQGLVRERFSAKYPACKLKPSTLMTYATKLNQGQRTTIAAVAEPVSVPFWDDVKRGFLLDCAIAARQELIERANMGVVVKRGEGPTTFAALTAQRFLNVYPDVTRPTIYRHLKKIEDFVDVDGPFDAPDEELPAHERAEFALIMESWEQGFRLGTRSLFSACCHRCSALIVDSAYPAKAEVANTVRPNITKYYPPEYLGVTWTKSEGRGYTCGRCTRVDMLGAYPLAPEGQKIRPLPLAIARLTPQERGQIGLVALHATTTKPADDRTGQFRHVMGAPVAKQQQDERYTRLYAMIIEKKSARRGRASSDENIRAALRWLRLNNDLYRSFRANYETLLRYRPAEEDRPANLVAFDDLQLVPVEGTTGEALEEEQRGLLVPASNVKGREGGSLKTTVAAAHHIRQREAALKAHRAQTRVFYGDVDLEPKVFPHLFPFGTGGWSWKGRSGGPAVTRGEYCRFRYIMADDRFRTDSSYGFYVLDIIIKERIKAYNAVRVNTKNLLEPLTEDQVRRDADVHEKYGTEVPATVPNSRNFWAQKTSDLVELTIYKGRQPDLFITLTQNDAWPELQAFMISGVGGQYDCADKTTMPVPRITEHPVDHPMEVCSAFYRRFELFRRRVLLSKDGGIFGKVEDHWYRVEYQNRGGLHVHCVLWVEEGTLPERPVNAEVPRTRHPNNQQWRQHVLQYQLHKCKENRCQKTKRGKTLKTCKFGFPFTINHQEKPDPMGLRTLYVRREAEDAAVTPYSLPLLLMWCGHVNVQRITSGGWEIYLCKYIAKSASTVNVGLKKKKSKEKKNTAPRSAAQESEVTAYLQTRVVSSMECAALLLQRPHVGSTRDIIYLPIDPEPDVRILKSRRHLEQGAPGGSVYYDTKLQKYLQRPSSLARCTYPEFYAKYRYESTYGAAKENEVIDDPDDSAEGEGSEGDDITTPQAVLEDAAPPRKRRRQTARAEALVDRKGRKIRKRRGREAVTYFPNFSPHGPNLEKYCLAKLLKTVPVDEETLERLRTNTGSYLGECLQRGLIDRESEAMHFLEGAAKRGFSVERLRSTVQQMIDGNWLPDQDVDALLETVAPHHIETEEAVRRELADQEIDDEETHLFEVQGRRYPPLEDYLAQFSPCQEKAYRFVTDRLDRGEQVCAVITGAGGTGKTFLLDALVAYCKRTELPAQKVATTGCAAHLIGGATIHGFFRLDLELKCHLEYGSKEAFFVGKVQVLFLDEMSMLRDTLLVAIDDVLRRFSGVDRPYGGKSILMFGDPAQLPPIGRSIWRQELMGPFDVLVLRTNMRVRGGDEAEFLSLLNRVRLGEPSPEDIALLQSRVIADPQSLPPLPSGANLDLHLVGTRAAKRDIDEVALRNTPGDDVKTYHAQDLDSHDRPVPYFIQKDIHNAEKTAQLLPRVINLKIGCRVMLIKNVDVPHGWINGRIATVESLTNDYIVIRSVEDPDLRMVANRFKQPVHLKHRGPLIYYRHQFPLELSYAATIHKAQGQTLSRAVVGAQRLRTSGQFYTAISRVRSLDSLYLTSFDPSSVFLSARFRDLLHWMDEVDVLTSPVSRRDRRPVPEGQRREDSPPPPSSGGTPSPHTSDEEAPQPRLPPAPSIPAPIVARKTVPPEPRAPADPILTFLQSVYDIPTELPEQEYVRRFSSIPVPEELRQLEAALPTTASHVFTPNSHTIHGSLARSMNRAQLEHFKPIVTPGDGSCLFYALSFGLFGHRHKALALRALTLIVFGRHLEHFRQSEVFHDFRSLTLMFHDTAIVSGVKLSPQDDPRFPPPQHCTRAEAEERNKRGWGSSHHLKAIAIAARRPVYVYRDVDTEDRQNAYHTLASHELHAAMAGVELPHVRLEPFDQGPESYPLMVHLEGAIHYSAVLPVDKTVPVYVPNALADAFAPDP